MEKTSSKKVLFMEARENLFGHVRQNESIIKALSNVCQLSIAFPKQWIKDIPENVTEYNYNPPQYSIKENIAQILKSLKCMSIAKELDSKEHYDCIIFASYNVYAMFFARLMFRNMKGRIYVIHHNIMDQLDESAIKRLLFNTYKHSLNHILIEKFVAENFAENSKVDRKNIYYFSHQLNYFPGEGDIEKDIDYLGISNSNDEYWIENIIDAEKSRENFKQNGIRIIVRSTKYEFDNGFLKVFKGRLDDSAYYNMVLRSKVILIPFPESFKFRVSGSVVDGFSNNIRVIGSNIPIISEYCKEYPHICKAGISVDDILHDYSDYSEPLEEQLREFEKFRNSHKFKTMELEFKNIVDHRSNLID